jgi:hypothetical protein
MDKTTVSVSVSAFENPINTTEIKEPMMLKEESKKPDTVVYVPINGANLRNNHLTLTSYKYLFSRDVVGGSNKQNQAYNKIRLECDGVGEVYTDIDGKKWKFRDRKLMRQFFEHHKALDGDKVKLTKVSDQHFKLQLIKS